MYRISLERLERTGLQAAPPTLSPCGPCAALRWTIVLQAMAYYESSVHGAKDSAAVSPHVLQGKLSITNIFEELRYSIVMYSYSQVLSGRLILTNAPTGQGHSSDRRTRRVLCCYFFFSLANLRNCLALPTFQGISLQ